jgi:beta-N-acetylhexosaminidase
MRIAVVMMMVWGALNARVSDRMIANMFVLGFEGKKLSHTSTIVHDICERGLGGVILFRKNISAPSQLRSLTSQLSRCRHKPLIAVDQEGGKVRRIRFGKDYPRASKVAKMSKTKAKMIYEKMAKELHALGINYNLAPVADLAINPKNRVIYKLGRSYGYNPDKVILYNKIFINAMHKYSVLTSLKHFPGHGSSMGDTHQGFVDVSKTWDPDELEPFRNPKADSIMVAHVVISQSNKVPASLSRRAIDRTLRRDLAYGGVVITDDLQMGAIRNHYGLEQTIALAINAGNDLLLFGNQLSKKRKVTTSQLIKIVRRLIAKQQVSPKSIARANRRIAAMRKKIRL